MRIIILDPGSTDPAWGAAEGAIIVDMPEFFNGWDECYSDEEQEEINRAIEDGVDIK